MNSKSEVFDLVGFALQISKRLNGGVGHLEDWQREEFSAINDVLNGKTPRRRIAICSGHGVGKSFFLAVLITYCVVSCKSLTGIATANTGDQFSSTLGLYIRTMARLLRGKLSIRTNRIFNTLNPEIQIAFRTYNPLTPEAFQGVHGDLVLLVIDEASALPNSLFELLEGATTGGRYIYVLTGNPTKVGTYFHSLFPKEGGEYLKRSVANELSPWNTRRVSSLEVSIVDHEFNTNLIRMYGADSDEYRVRVLGEFPKNESNAHTLFESQDIEKIYINGVDFSEKLDYNIGIDIASIGGSKTIVTVAHHNTESQEIEISQVYSFKGLTIPQQIEQLINNLKALPQTAKITIVLDYTGIGIAFGQYLSIELRKFRRPSPKVIPVNFAAKPTYFKTLMSEQNMRTWLYTNLKQILQKDISVCFGRNTITKDDLFRLHQTILALRFDLTTHLRAEPKSSTGDHDLLDSLLLSILPLGVK